jgi:uncharacterized membrane-anchored protein
LAPARERGAIAIAVSFQVAVLLSMILLHTIPFLGARTVLLLVEPVDPRDLFRGDYVTLSYAFTRTPSGKYKPGQTVYVQLVPEGDGRHYHAGAFLTDPPAGGLFVRGIAGSYSRASYGIESFYLREGTGHDYEAAVRRRRLWAEVALDRLGNPALRRLVIE